VIFELLEFSQCLIDTPNEFNYVAVIIVGGIVVQVQSDTEKGLGLRLVEQDRVFREDLHLEAATQ
jgi:hypothetical protein